MPHYPIIVDADNDEYLVWSTIVDAPVSWIINEAQLKAHFHIRPEDDWPEDFYPQPFGNERYNRAGPNEAQLTPEQIVTSLREHRDPSTGEKHG